MRSFVVFVFVIAYIAFCESAVVQLQRVRRQFGVLTPFGPTRGPPPPFGGPFGGPNFFPGNFPGFGPPAGPPPNFRQPPINFGGPRPNFVSVNRGATGFNPLASTNINQRQANNPQIRQQQQPAPQPSQQQVARQQQVNRNSPSYKNCMGDCQTTNEYNPVCGNDQQDYYNEQRLECARRCGINVQTVRRGTCNITNN